MASNSNRTPKTIKNVTECKSKCSKCGGKDDSVGKAVGVDVACQTDFSFLLKTQPRDRKEGAKLSQTKGANEHDEESDDEVEKPKKEPIVDWALYKQARSYAEVVKVCGQEFADMPCPKCQQPKKNYPGHIYQCIFCDDCLEWVTNRSTHFKACPGKENPLKEKCDICLRRVVARNMNRHLQNKHKDKFNSKKNDTDIEKNLKKHSQDSDFSPSEKSTSTAPKTAAQRKNYPLQEEVPTTGTNSSTGPRKSGKELFSEVTGSQAKKRKLDSRRKYKDAPPFKRHARLKTTEGIVPENEIGNSSKQSSNLDLESSKKSLSDQSPVNESKPTQADFSRREKDKRKNESLSASGERELSYQKQKYPRNESHKRNEDEKRKISGLEGREKENRKKDSSSGYGEVVKSSRNEQIPRKESHRTAVDEKIKTSGLEGREKGHRKKDSSSAYGEDSKSSKNKKNPRNESPKTTVDEKRKTSGLEGREKEHRRKDSSSTKEEDAKLSKNPKYPRNESHRRTVDEKKNTSGLEAREKEKHPKDYSSAYGEQNIQKSNQKLAYEDKKHSADLDGRDKEKRQKERTEKNNKHHKSSRHRSPKPNSNDKLSDHHARHHKSSYRSKTHHDRKNRDKRSSEERGERRNRDRSRSERRGEPKKSKPDAESVTTKQISSSVQNDSPTPKNVNKSINEILDELDINVPTNEDVHSPGNNEKEIAPLGLPSTPSAPISPSVPAPPSVPAQPSVPPQPSVPDQTSVPAPQTLTDPPSAPTSVHSPPSVSAPPPIEASEIDANTPNTPIKTKAGSSPCQENFYNHLQDADISLQQQKGENEVETSNNSFDFEHIDESILDNFHQFFVDGELVPY